MAQAFERRSDSVVQHYSALAPAQQAYAILFAGFIALPIIAGLDKFLHIFTHWEKYLAPVVPRVLNIEAHTFMLAVGVIEIVAGLLVAWRPRIGAYVVALWLLGIIVNLVMLGNYFDIALRDFGLALGALALGRLSLAHDAKPLGF